MPLIRLIQTERYQDDIDDDNQEEQTKERQKSKQMSMEKSSGPTNPCSIEEEKNIIINKVVVNQNKTGWQPINKRKSSRNSTPATATYVRSKAIKQRNQ